ncbi:S23 ribosomal protein (modular protein) [uncultured Paludibacter sp.]|uniref:S23 ribosomal protein (Modular protein) n=1 Tax=uncultured Paludibacter sp. TaxID=497635 RepID=A0A653AHC7_9BACT|nr:S23 ribosomal protein (modular protein) [uncultured Paludibacter sp.]
MDKSKSFKDLIMWQKSHQYVLKVYRNTEKFPSHEQFNLTSQFRRAATSISLNIVEGYRRISKVEKLRFFNMAQTSLDETHYCIILSKDLNYISENQYCELIEAMENANKAINSYCYKLVQDIKNEKNKNKKNNDNEVSDIE